MHLTDEIRKVLLLLKSLGVNYPVLRECGYVPDKLIGIYVSTGQTQNLVRILTNQNTVCADIFSKPKDLRSTIVETNSEYVFYPFRNERKCNEHLRMFQSMLSIGGISEVYALPLIISETPFPKELFQELFIIYLTGDLSDINISLEDVVPPDDQLEVVFDKIYSIPSQEKSSISHVLNVAACFTYPCLKAVGQKNTLSELMKISDLLLAQDENNRDTNDLVETFISDLYFWQQTEQFYDIYKLPNLDMSMEKRIDKIIVYNSEYVFLSEEIFGEICKNLLRFFSSSVIKHALAEAGVLCPENSTSFTVKVGYFDIIGQYKRVRKLRFKRSKLIRFGELDFVDSFTGGVMDEN